MRGRGRPFNRSTPLGQILWQRGYTLTKVERNTGISYRTMSDYLAGRKSIIPGHMALLCDELNLSRAQILGEVEPTVDSNTVPAGKLDTGKLVAGMVGAMKRGTT